jgi:leader peptidase (prepilin peptidase)/N-methyltransferase
MSWDIAFLVIVALSLGSFSNSCIYRLPEGLSLFGDRSFCPSCKTPLTWSELIPIISFTALRGRCRHCQRPISWQYPLVEGLILLLFLIAYLKYDISTHFAGAVLLFIVLIPVILIDWKHFLIPNGLLITGSILWLLLSLATDREIILTGLISGGVAIGIMALISAAGQWFFGRPSLGAGDVKLAGVFGLYLGWEYFLLALWGAALLAMAYGVMVMVVQRRSFAGMKLPFGSFLGGASIFVYLFQDEIGLVFLRWTTLF